MDEHVDQIRNTPDISPTGKNNIAETVPVNRIPIRKVDLSNLLNRNSPRIREWETDSNIRLNVSAYPNITLFDQWIEPRIDSVGSAKFMPYQEKAIAKKRPEEAWSETLMTAVSDALHNAMLDSEGIASRRRSPQIGITSNINIDEDKLIIEIKDNGPGIPKKIADKLNPGYILSEEEETAGYELSDIKVGNRLRQIYEGIKQIGGKVELFTNRIEDLKPGETSGTTIRFTFPLNTQ